MTRILVVDDDPAELRLLCGLLADAGYTPIAASGGDAALDMLRDEERPAAMLLDLVMPDRDGMAVLDAMAREGIDVPAILLCTGAEDAAMPAIRRGAMDFVVKPVHTERLLVSLRNALRLVELEGLLRTGQGLAAGTPELGDLIAQDEAMQRVRLQIGKAARSGLPVLLEGEAGTGKSLVARIMHASSDRAGRPFVTFDCASLPARDAEAVLFGDQRPGQPARTALVRKAHGGTLLLREVGALSASAQARLLRLMESGDIAEQGNRPDRVNVRIIAASRTRLLNLARAGRLREDLFYRLNVMPLYLPPLRQRSVDVAPLARRAMLRAGAEAGRRMEAIAPAALELLATHDWPGNVAELETRLWRAVALATGPRLEIADFPELIRSREGRDGLLAAGSTPTLPSAPVHIDDSTMPDVNAASTPDADRFIDNSGTISPLETVERDLIAFALAHHQGHMSRVARALGIGRSTLYRKIRLYNLEGGVSVDAA